MKLRLAVVTYNALLFVPLGSCAPTTPQSIYKLTPDLTISSSKSPRDFAMCVSGVLSDANQILNEGDHYWVVRNVSGVAVERWDFAPTATGSIGERRTGQLVKNGADRVRSCA